MRATWQPVDPAEFDPRQFAASPLYVALCATAATNEPVRSLAARARTGQRPAFALFGAVHLLLLAGADHELAAFYPSVVGAGRARPSAEVGPAFVGFCAAFQDELAAIVERRLVQTNHVRRAVGLRTALAAIAPHVRGPVDLVEVGASAGLLLRVDRYGYRLGGQRYGDRSSPIQLATELRGDVALPDLDAVPDLASVTGVDLAPLDVRDPDSRAWLTALVWPEDDEQRGLLTSALDLVAADPPHVITGDAVDALPRLAGTLAPGRDRVVYHSATRIHVPTERLAAFDAAVEAVGETGPLWHVSVETPADGLDARSRDGVALRVTDPGGDTRVIAAVDGHLRWIEPLASASVATKASA